MFLDTQDLAPPPPNFGLSAAPPREGPGWVHAQVVIIGGGPAGISLGLELADRGHEVIVLEAGAQERSTEAQDRYKGGYSGTFVTQPQPNYVGTSRVRQLGGSTNHWAGMCRPLDAIDFEKRDWVPHSGWPFSRDELLPYYDRACAWVELPTFPELHKERIPLPNLFKGAPDIQDAPFLISPPTRFISTYQERMATHPKLRVILNANVVELVAHPDGHTLDHVVFRSLEGPLQRAAGRAYVLATGGIENPRLLLNSDGVHKNGLGNAHDLVGRYFMDHPHYDAVLLAATRRVRDYNRYRRQNLTVMGQRKTRVLPVFSITEAAQREHQLVGASFQLRPRGKRAEQEFLARLTRLQHPTPRGDGLRIQTLLARTEQVPNPDSRVTLTAERDDLGLRRVKVDWRLVDADREIAARTLQRVTTAFARLGLGRARSYVQADRPWPKGGGGFHHMGTTRMHTSPQHGVVDAQCKMHSLQNVYIAGSSVFPTCGYANPTLSIIALALRLGDHLHRELS